MQPDATGARQRAVESVPRQRVLEVVPVLGGGQHPAGPGLPQHGLDGRHRRVGEARQRVGIERRAQCGRRRQPLGGVGTEFQDAVLHDLAERRG